MFVLDEFEALPLTLQQRWLELYIRYDKAANRLSVFFTQLNSANTHWGEIIPTLKMLPASMISHLAEVVSYGAVPTEDLTAVLGGAKTETAAAAPVSKKADPELPPQQPVSATAPPPTPLNPPSAARPAVATAPPANALDDLFSPVAPHTTTTTATHREDVWSQQPPQRTNNNAQQATTVQDLFGPAAPPPQQRYSPQETSLAPSAANNAPKSTEFDPFAPTPAPAKQPAPAGGEVDFFFSGTTPQQQYSRQAQQQPSAAPATTNSNPAPFSEFGTASQAKPKAW